MTYECSFFLPRSALPGLVGAQKEELSPIAPGGFKLVKGSNAQPSNVVHFVDWGFYLIVSGIALARAFRTDAILICVFMFLRLLVL